MKPFRRILPPALLCGVHILLLGCGNLAGPVGAPTSTAGLAAGGASSIYLVEQGSSTSAILIFPITSAGSATPTGKLTLPSGVIATAVATDAVGQIYVGADDINSGALVLVYAPGSTGVAAPTRSILGSSSVNSGTFTHPYSITVDANGFLYVTSITYSGGSASSVAVFPPNANGSVKPTTFLTGSATGMTFVKGIAIDSLGFLYLANSDGVTPSSVLVFPPGATGNVAPAKSIATGAFLYGVALDSSSNIYVAQDLYTSSGSIVEFAAGASGAATPIKTIAGAATNFFFGYGLKVDPAGNIFVVSQTTGSATNSLLAFPPTASGNVAPTVSFTSSAWNLGGTELALR